MRRAKRRHWDLVQYQASFIRFLFVLHVPPTPCMALPTTHDLCNQINSAGIISKTETALRNIPNLYMGGPQAFQRVYWAGTWYTPPAIPSSPDARKGTHPQGLATTVSSAPCCGVRNLRRKTT